MISLSLIHIYVRERYFLSEEMTEALLDKLCRCKKAVEDQGVYYHEKLYERARDCLLYTSRPPGEHGQVRRYPEQRVEKKSVNQFRERFRAVCALFRFAVRTVRKRAGKMCIRDRYMRTGWEGIETWSRTVLFGGGGKNLLNFRILKIR